MSPAVAAHAIATYSKPGDLVVDPMCGVGTTLVEAMHLDRMAIGVEKEQSCTALAMQNIEHAVDCGAPGFATVVTGDPREAGALVGRDVCGRASLMLVALPQGLGDPGCDSGAPAYGPRWTIEAFAQVLSECHALLKPGGFLVIAARGRRCLGEAGDGAILAAKVAVDAGFALHQRSAVLLAASPDIVPIACVSDFPLADSDSALAVGDSRRFVAREAIVVARVDRLGDHPIESTGCGCVPDQRYNTSSRRSA